jgi:hypothetical protein
MSGGIGRQNKKRRRQQTINRGHSFASSSQLRSLEETTVVPTNNSEADEDYYSSGRKRKGSNCALSEGSPFNDRTLSVTNCCSPEENCCVTKRHRSDLGASLIEIGRDTKEMLNSLTCKMIGKKIGHVLKEYVPSMSERCSLVSSFVAAIGVVSAENVNFTAPLLPPQTLNHRPRPSITPTKQIEKPVVFDGDIFFTALQDGESPVPASTASTHKCRARNDVNTALNRHGTLEHQAAIIHDICTVGPKAGIGVALGILDNPEKHASVVEHLFQDTFEVLHCDRVIGKNNTQAIEFTHNTFLATAPTAPPENATAEEKKAYRQKFIKYCDEMQLTAGMRKKAQNAGIRRREILYADDTQDTLTYEWKRKSPSDKKLTPGMIEAVQEWLFSSCKLVDPSPNKRDEVYTKLRRLERNTR